MCLGRCRSLVALECRLAREGAMAASGTAGTMPWGEGDGEGRAAHMWYTYDRTNGRREGSDAAQEEGKSKENVKRIQRYAVRPLWKREK